MLVATPKSKETSMLLPYPKNRIKGEQHLNKNHYQDLKQTEVKLSTWNGRDCSMGGGMGLRCGSPTHEHGDGGHLGASGGGGCQLADEESSGRWWQRADPSIEVGGGQPSVEASLEAQCVPKP